MRILVCLIVGVSSLPCSPSAVARGRRALDVAALSLGDRCQAASLVAMNILEVLDFVDRVPLHIKPAPRLNLFFSRLGDGDEDQSIFRKGETCGQTWVRNPEHRDNEPARVEVNLATGSAPQLPPEETYNLVLSETLGANRWRFQWKPGNEPTRCDLGPEPGKSPAVCVHNAVTGVWHPVLEVTVVRNPHRGGADRMQAEKAILVLIRYDAGFEVERK